KSSLPAATTSGPTSICVSSVGTNPASIAALRTICARKPSALPACASNARATSASIELIAYFMYPNDLLQVGSARLGCHKRHLAQFVIGQPPAREHLPLQIVVLTGEQLQFCSFQLRDGSSRRL